jgi:hypothetical protein
VPGELYVGGVGLARGYHGRAAATAERFVPDPYAGRPGARMYRTGDVTRYRPDGRLLFLGRRDHQLKLRGVRIEPGEIESVMARHPEVSSALAQVRDVGGQPVLVAYAVTDRPRADYPKVRAGLLEHLRRHLPTAMVPSVLVPLAAWPVTVNGKLDRRALPDPELAVAAPYEPPATDQERAIAGVWSGLLGGRRVGRLDDFFALGGHSLLAARAALLIGEAARVEVPVVLVFIHPTIAQLAAAIEELTAGLAAPAGAAEPAPVALPRTDAQLDELIAQVEELPADVVAGLLDAQPSVKDRVNSRD